MTIEQLTKAKELRERIYELSALEHNLKSKSDVFIETGCYDVAKVKIPENSREVILALCTQERQKLEKEFEDL